jgi:hypothetical protein
MGKSRRMPLHAPATAAPGPASYHAQRASDEHAAGPAFSMPRAPETIGPGRYDVMPSATASAFSRIATRIVLVACGRGQTQVGDTARLLRCVARCPLHGRLSHVASRSLSVRRTSSVRRNAVVRWRLRLRLRWRSRWTRASMRPSPSRSADSVGARLSDGGACILCRIIRRVRIGPFDYRRE